MLKIQFISNGYVGKSIFATDITLNKQVILPSAYLAASQVTIIDDNDKGQDNVKVTALVPTWLIESKIQDYKKESVEADKNTVDYILELASTN